MKLELLIQYIEGSSDKMLVDRVEAWLAEDATNETYLEKVRTVWSYIDELRELASIDINKDWAKIEQRLFASDDSRNKKATGNFWRMNSPLMKVAAIFFVVVLFSGLIWFFLGQNPTPNQMAQNFYEFNVPMGQKSSLVLPDGTKIMVNAGSKLRIPQEDPSGKREIWLDGEAFFQVTKDPSNPFYVHTPNIQVKVLGTTFNVRAYEDEHLVETTLIEGKVNLTNLYKADEEIDLAPNHKAILVLDKDVKLSSAIGREFGEDLRVGKLMVSNAIDPISAISWTQGKLVFKEEQFEFIAEQLERFYGVKIEIEDESLKYNKYTGTIKNISLEQTLKALQVISDFNFVINDEDVIISK